MSKVTTAETIVPAHLPLRERKRLGHLLYEVHAQIFGGLTEDDFRRYTVDSTATTTKIFVYRNNNEKRIIGYFAVHRFEKSSAAGTVEVFRAEAGLVPEYRRRNADLSWFLREIIKYKILHPASHIYFLAAPVNPSMYAILARYMYKVYPRYNSPIPTLVRRLMLHLAEQFALSPVEGEAELVRKVGWKTHASDAEKEFWRNTRNPHVRFYITSNPHFSDGNGLLTLIPFDFPNLAVSVITFFAYTVKKRIRSHLRTCL
jgi:hypothetical protein